MKGLNTEAYVSCLTLISASGNSFIAINQSGPAQTGSVSLAWQSTGMTCRTTTLRHKSTTNPQRFFSSVWFRWLEGAVWVGRVLVRFKDEMSKSLRLWCFLAGFSHWLSDDLGARAFLNPILPSVILPSSDKHFNVTRLNTDGETVTTKPGWGVHL